MLSKEQILEARGVAVDLWLKGVISDEDFKSLMRPILDMLGETPVIQ